MKTDIVSVIMKVGTTMFLVFYIHDKFHNMDLHTGVFN